MNRAEYSRIFSVLNRIYDDSEASLGRLEKIDGLLESAGFTGERDDISKQLHNLLSSLEDILPGLEGVIRGEI